MTTRKINISIPLENNGLFTYEIWQNYINDIPRVEGVDSYEVNVMLEEGWKIIYGGAFMNITEGEDIDEENGSQIADDVIIFSLVNILLPSSITNINANAFTYTTNLDRLGFQRNNNIKIHPNAFRGSGLQKVLIHSSTLRVLNMSLEILDGLELKFGKNNYFYGKDNVNINDVSAYIPAGGARKSRRRNRGARKIKKRRRRRTMKRK